MKNILRRSLSWLLILVMVLGLVPQTPVFASDEVLAPPVELEEAAPETEAVPEETAGDSLLAVSGTCGDNLTWTLDNEGVLTISGTGNMKYSSPYPWASYAESITSVIITDGVTSIGDNAFGVHSNLKSVSLPDKMDSIGDFAFYDCRSLTSINLPEGITTIGYSTFSRCTSLVSISLPESLTSIGATAFSSCIKLTGITIPANVTDIGELAFCMCDSLTSVTFCGDAPNISSQAFDSVAGGGDVLVATAYYPANNATWTEDVVQGYYGGKLTWVPYTSEHDHQWGTDTVTTPAGCTTTGNKTNTCSICGKTKTEVIPAVGHDYKSTVTAPTCTGKGYTTHVCSRCSDSYKDTEVNATGHSWNAGVVTKEPTITATGVKTYTCGKCSKTKTEDIPVLEVGVPAKPYKITNVVFGVHVYWKAVDGISKYGLWRSETGKDGTYKWVGNPSATHFTDKDVESGKTYYYKVSAINPVTSEHSDKSEAIGITYVATPEITLRVNRAVGIGLRWNAVEGATGYAIYRKSYYGTDAWVRVKTIAGGSTLAWDDTSVKNANGSVYKYTVRALAGSDMKTLSGCRNAGSTMVRLTSLTLSSATAASKNSIKCTWTKNAQATGYEVRFMVGSTVVKTVTVGNPNTVTKTINQLASGKTYKIQVRSYKRVESVGSFYSAWSTAKNVKLG